MPKLDFQLGHSYVINLREKLRYGDITEQRLARRFTDGRLSGLLNEELVVAHFRGLHINEDAGASYDIYGDRAELYEVKTVTPRAVSLRPSNQHGQGRVKDDDVALERIRSITGYILVDVRDTPTVTVYFVSSTALVRFGKYEMSTAQFDRAIQQLLRWSRGI